MKFNYTESEMEVLKNFAKINVSMIIYPDRFVVANTFRSVYGVYKFEKPYDYEPYGIYEVNKFVQLLDETKEYDLEVHDRYISVFNKTVSAETKYHLTPSSMLPNIDEEKFKIKFDSVDCQLQFNFSGEKLKSLMTISNVLKLERVFFESLKGKIRIIAGNKSLIKSTNPHEIIVKSDDITENSLGENMLYLKKDEFKLLDGDYVVKISNSGISSWYNEFKKINYFIGIAMVDINEEGEEIE